MYTLAFSPCPNDTFIFDALVNNKIDTEGLQFNVVLEDVQTLNNWALQGKMDFTKISYGVAPLIINNYTILNSGGALGKGVGPLLISKKQIDSAYIDNKFAIAIPGENTTAHFLFSLAFPHFSNKVFLPFHQIENFVLHNENVMGVIIHENRFTYQEKGLHKILDLGNYWEQKTQLPIPLGGIVAHRRIDVAIVKKLDTLIQKSIEYAFANYPILSNYVKQHSQEMDETVMRQHINLYVNNFSLKIGFDGKQAIENMFKIFCELYPANCKPFDDIFLK